MSSSLAAYAEQCCTRIEDADEQLAGWLAGGLAGWLSLQSQDALTPGRGDGGDIAETCDMQAQHLNHDERVPPMSRHLPADASWYEPLKSIVNTSLAFDTSKRPPPLNSSTPASADSSSPT